MGIESVAILENSKMTPHTGKLYFVMIASVLLSCIASWIIARRYRGRMRQLMRVPQAGSLPAPMAETAPGTESASNAHPPAQATLAGNRRAGMRLSMLLAAVSCLIALSSACIWWTLVFPGEPMPAKRVAVVALLHLWPVVPALALVWRWSRSRLFGALLLWCAATYAVFLWRQIEPRPLEAMLAMASEIGLSLALVSAVFLGSATRAIAPWLLVPTALLLSAMLVGLDVLSWMAGHESPLLMLLIQPLEWLPGWSGVVVVFGIFLLLAGIIAWWPMRMSGRALGHAYSRKWLSDLLVLFTGVWAFALTDRTLTLSASIGVEAFAMYLSLLWIPVVMWLAGRFRQGRALPPTLLVLRVFQQDVQMQSLYDQVVERWRLSGNTVMIAGTDLADRTLDAGDIFQFLDGKLAQQFIISPADVTRRIDAFDMAADIDGRYRVNECYCHHTTWRDALQALVHRSDVVLMDLRGFQAHNAGCRHELATLARAARALRVVVLTDGRTDRAVAQADVASGRHERFTWIEVSRLDARMRRQVLAGLLA
ncbi:MAG TPA: hypothetical protein PK743_03545 [Luteimonas sp.]|nr:hypothetical protein [Luteimonas sp.]HRO26483.1 hypothetical protein [Luteimonas sp.]HRP71695.1 hypothetical protein [Luteimonas sp.]